MAVGAEEPIDLSDVEMESQLQYAGLCEEAADNLCPICLSEIENPSYISICFHAFCLGCIQRWMYMNGVCPVCRLPFDCILHTVKADDDYQEYKVNASNIQQGTTGRRRGRSRPPQHQTLLRPRPTNNEPRGATRGPGERQRGAQRGRGRGTSSDMTRQDALERLAFSMEGPLLRSHVRNLRTQS
ncbi:hypothetical protein llap_4238 [Limosa lapponica baueri]|uniref:RING-type E3 ubiquitin transferase n=1 Tax=Limosa lapponica baueri TaxID=1758121 RepID=A0A2I0UHI2_LIMLA|nr:hypothetical protein llap_4238 [Limosa lapponica baueri]